MAIIVKEVGNFIKFYKDGIDIYSIPSRECTDVRDVDSSEWIHHLMTKTWIQPTNLYELAAIIKKYDTSYQINWVNTFFPVEKKQYLEHVYSLKQDQGLTLSDTLIRNVKIGIEEQNDEINDQINVIVTRKLKEFGIL